MSVLLGKFCDTKINCEKYLISHLKTENILRLLNVFNTLHLIILIIYALTISMTNVIATNEWILSNFSSQIGIIWNYEGILIQNFGL